MKISIYNGQIQLFVAMLFILFSLLSLRRERKYAVPLAVLYVAACVYVLLFMRNPTSVPKVNLEPFRVLKRAIRISDGIHIGNEGQIRIIVLNILLFVPFGYLLPTLWRKADRWWKTVLLGFAASLTVELLQFSTHLGMFDVDDLINNTIGAGLGYFLFWVFLRERINASKTEKADDDADGG